MMPTAPSPLRHTFGPLQRRLGMVAAIALLPLAALALVNVINSVEAQRESVLQTAGDTVRAMSGAIDAELKASMAALETLTLSPRLQSGDLRGFHAEARELIARRPTWTNIALINARGQQQMNAALNWGAPLPKTLAALDATDAVLRDNAPKVAGVIFGPLSKQYIFSIHIPARVNGAQMVISASLKPEAVLSLATRQRVDAPGIIVIVDASGKVVARSRGQTEFVGKTATESFRKLTTGRDEGWGEARTLDGEDVVSVFQRSQLTGWVASVGLPRDVVDGPVLRRYLLLGSGLIGSLALGLLAAWGVSLAISRPVQALGEAAAAMGAGKRPQVPDTPLPEIRQVGEALAAAHTERDKLLRGEREARRQAEEANRLKDEFLAMLGHELRNPLSAISNASQILDHVDDTRSGIGREATAIIRRQSAHLALLTDELLDVARVMSGNIPMERVPVNLAEAVERTVATFRATGRLDKHEVTVTLAPAWVAADATRLDQIANNLLTNAVKYTPEGGSIRLAVYREKPEDGGHARLDVSDKGMGLEPDLLDRVFDLFVQGARSLDRAQGGLGVGLTLVKKLAELLGGSVSAHSEGAWKGSRFTVRLPAIEPPADMAEAAMPAAAPRACTVVIVEDNEDARQSMRVLLALEGHQVHEAADGNAGIEAILRVKPDVALVDIGLPGVDGYEVARRVRAQLGATIKLVAATGYGLPEDRRKSAEAGFDLHLVKPVDMEGLAKVFGMSNGRASD